jgi:hypothetical protein
MWDYSVFQCCRRVCKVRYLSDLENNKMNSSNKFDPLLHPPTHARMHVHTKEKCQEWRATSTPEVCGCRVVILQADSLGQKSTSFLTSGWLWTLLKKLSICFAVYCECILYEICQHDLSSHWYYLKLCGSRSREWCHSLLAHLVSGWKWFSHDLFKITAAFSFIVGQSCT